MKVVTLHAAKTQLLRRLAEVEAGAEIALARGRTPIAKRTACSPPPEARVFGAMKREVDVGDEPLEP